jgi:hypothetical protein
MMGDKIEKLLDRHFYSLPVEVPRFDDEDF